MRVNARSMCEMKGLDGSNPPLSTIQSSKLDRLRAKSAFRLRLLTALSSYSLTRPVVLEKER